MFQRLNRLDHSLVLLVAHVTWLRLRIILNFSNTLSKYGKCSLSILFLYQKHKHKIYIFERCVCMSLTVYHGDCLWPCIKVLCFLSTESAKNNLVSPSFLDIQIVFNLLFLYLRQNNLVHMLFDFPV